MNDAKLKRSFRKVRQDVDMVRYDMHNALRYLTVQVKEQGIRIKELERRLSQAERLALREVMA